MAGQRAESGRSAGQNSNASRLPLPRRFRNGVAARVSVRARLMYILPLPLLFGGLGAIGRGDAAQTLVELGGFAGLMLSAWLLNEGLRAEVAYDARTIAKPPAIPRKALAAGLTGFCVLGIGVLSRGQDVLTGSAFGIVAGLALLGAFGLDPTRRKGMDGVDDLATDRVARAIDQAEALVGDTLSAAARMGDRRLQKRVERLCDQAREVFRALEADPQDLTRTRAFLSVYLLGLRDATMKFADLQGRMRDADAQAKYEALIGDLEASFVGHRTVLLADDRSDLEVEIEVLRDRLKQDGLLAR